MKWHQLKVVIVSFKKKGGCPNTMIVTHLGDQFGELVLEGVGADTEHGCDQDGRIYPSDCEQERGREGGMKKGQRMDRALGDGAISDGERTGDGLGESGRGMDVSTV